MRRRRQATKEVAREMASRVATLLRVGELRLGQMHLLQWGSGGEGRGLTIPCTKAAACKSVLCKHFRRRFVPGPLGSPCESSLEVAR
jgi:hypothetical protein